MHHDKRHQGNDVPSKSVQAGQMSKEEGKAEEKGEGSENENNLDQMKETLAAAPGKLKDGIAHVAEQVEEQLAPAGKWARETVQKQPLALIGAALGAGVCLGFGAGCLVGALALRSK